MKQVLMLGIVVLMLLGIVAACETPVQPPATCDTCTTITPPTTPAPVETPATTPAPQAPHKVVKIKMLPTQ